MRVIADLHIHSRYSRATSLSMDLKSIAFYAGVKGLNLVGTGDALHPLWLKELTDELEPHEDSGLYRLRGKPGSEPLFMLSTEVSTVYTYEGRIRKIHHVILFPSLEVVQQVADALKARGNLESDGRPTLDMASPELVERLLQVSRKLEVFPAHAWTPWFSIFGANSGFDSVEECYQDQADNIHALETGLSSDPLMNWRLSGLDRYTLLSNSDCHSPQPHRLGREANAFELKTPTYEEIVDAVRNKDPQRISFTIETRPEYGKYHWTGHRLCGVSMPPSEAIQLNSLCPKCRRMMTRGVEQRVEQLADRSPGYTPENSPSYVYLLPLHELLAAVLQASGPYSKKVQQVYSGLTRTLGSEFNVMLNTPLAQIAEKAGREIAEAVKAVRENTLHVTPGYDGVYGVLEVPSSRPKRAEGQGSGEARASIDSFMN